MRGSFVAGVVVVCATVAACTAPLPARPTPIPSPGTAVVPSCGAGATSTVAPPAPGPAVGPLVITAGGTYRGDWHSDDPAVPVVSIRTTEPVVIDGSRITGRGPLVVGDAGADLTVRNTVATAENPGRPGLVPGRFVDLHDAANVVIENDMLVGTSGIRLEGFTRRATPGTFRVVGNRVRNIDGRRSTGAGFSTDDSSAEYVQFVQLVSVPEVAAIDIGWNEVRNDPGHSRVEDVISVFLSSGTADSPITVHDNLIDGAYPTNPARDQVYSGGGIMLGDGDGPPGVRHVVALRNVVVDTTNYGMAVSSGSDIALRDNTVLADGVLHGGAYDGARIPAQNVGIYVYNLYDIPDFGPVEVAGNKVGWQSGKGPERNDFYAPDTVEPGHDQEFAGAVSAGEIDHSVAAWACRAQSAGVRVGP